MKSFQRQIKGISPIFATLILIAIAVIAGVVVYMFTSGALQGMTGGSQAGQEKIAIQAVSGTGTTITVYAQSIGGGSVPIDTVIIKNNAGTILGTDATVDPVATTLTTLSITSPTLTAGDSYTVTLVSKAGGNFVSTSFKAT